MNNEEKLKQLREDWKNVPKISDDVNDIKVRRKVIEIRAKLLQVKRPEKEYMTAEFWNK